MRKLLLLSIIWFLIPQAFAWTIVSWNSTSGLTNCTSTSDSVPTTNDTTVVTNWTNRACTEHKYYSSDDYTKSVSQWSHVTCNAWDKAISLTWSWPTKTLNCRKYDDTAPTSPSITSTTHVDNTWDNVDDAIMSITAWLSWPSPATTYYCNDTLNSCNPATPGTSTTLVNLSEWVHYFRAKTCDTWWCSLIVSFILKIDTSPAGNPTINSSSHTHNTWVNNDEAIMSIGHWTYWPDVNHTAFYCNDTTNTCDPQVVGNTWHNKTLTGLADGIHYFRAQMCDTWWCGSIVSFTLKVDTSLPGIPTITSLYHINDIWDADNAVTMNASKWVEWPSTSTIYHCLWINSSLCNPTGSASLPISHWTLVDWQHYWRAKVCDTWWCSSVVTFTIRIDTKVPTIWDILWLSPSNNANLVAGSATFSFNVWVNWWSPITSIKAFFEDYTKGDDSFNWIESSNNWTWIENEIFENVDLAREANWSRIYTLRVSDICDELYCAWDSLDSTLLKDYTFNIYANWNLASWTKEINPVDWNNIHNINNDNVADGTIDRLQIVLNDEYWNAIVPASWITRTIDFNFDVTNTLNYDQLNDNWDAVDLSIPSDSLNYTDRLPTGLTSFNNEPSTNWDYDFNFKVYAPTQTFDPILYNWNFIINEITYDINDPTFWNFIWTQVNNSLINFVFKPAFTTTITWELTSSWFIEWRTQTWSLEINDLWIGRPLSNFASKNLLFVQTWAIESTYFTWSWIITTVDSDNVDKRINTTYTATNLYVNDGLFINLETFSTYILKTLFTLLPWPWFIDDIKNIYLYQYISYSLDWKAIIYKAGELNSTNTQNIEIFKVFWITNIDTDKVEDLTANQSTEDVHNLAWEINKSNLKRDLRKNAINTVKVINPTNTGALINDLSWNVWDSANGWVILGDIIYYWDMWWNNVILDETFVTDITWRKTIIVEWWNLYIKSNIKNSTTSDILWVIVLQDDAWNWWKLYVDTEVNELDAVIYTDKSIISWYTITWTFYEVDWSTNNSITQNQLYIYGSIFSENTIWGSRKSPPVCPFWTEAISWFNCNITEAQKYDFNYLRSWTDNPEFIDTDGTIYPVVIKYNSALQSTPPPLFDK